MKVVREKQVVSSQESGTRGKYHSLAPGYLPLATRMEE